MNHAATQEPPITALLPAELHDRVHACTAAMVHVLAWQNPIERLAALSLVENAAFCAVFQATHELPSQLAAAAQEGVPA